MLVALGVTGCIAAYKAVEVMRGLQKLGVTVQVVMTRHATEFVRPLTFQAISHRPVITSMFAAADDTEIRHIELAQSIDLLVIAPATANALAKFACGIADDFLSTLYISTTAPVIVAPAMNVEMWAHAATRENVARLRARGVRFIDPEEGYLACRTVGAGRLADPEKIVQSVWDRLSLESFRQADMKGERVLITAGPTFEALDPVRGLTNRSSGKMGYALAEAALARGAEVMIVSGPVSLKAPEGARVVSVRSAAEMRQAVMNNLEWSTFVVCAAAVADYRPVSVSKQKIKKSGDRLVIEFEKTSDILAEAGRLKGDRLVVGFAAETQEVIENARKKLIEKKADLIVANDVTSVDSGFEVETNRIILVSSDQTTELGLMTKREAADRILDASLSFRNRTVAV
jgi:phosphopantothenoylcysteine decarboxylase/phosphopantothenate--cysteine ligase